MAKLLVPFALLLVLAGAMLVTDRPKPRADFVFQQRGDCSTLDLQHMSWMQDQRTARLVFEGLTRHDIFSPGLDVVPAAAERWEVSDDGRVYTFLIRPDARWSNGEPLRASDFVFSWRRAMLPDAPTDYIGLFQTIRGGKDFARWRQEELDRFAKGPGGRSAAEELWARSVEAFDAMVGVHAIDERTLRVELERPTPYFLNLVSMIVFGPVYPPLVSRYEHVDAESGRVRFELGWTKPPLIVGNGPFVLESWRFKREMRFRASPTYWGRAGLGVETISMPTIDDPTAVVLAYRAGSVDWITDVVGGYRGDMLEAKRRYYEENREAYESLRSHGLDPIEIDRRLPGDPRKDIHSLPAFGTYFYNFNCAAALPDGRANPFADARVRRAFAMAVDRRTIAEDVRRVGEPVATTIVPPGSLAGYRSPAGVGFDPEAARAILEEAGYPGGRGFITVRILFNKDSGHDLIAQAVARDWSRHLGVSVELDQKEIKVFQEDLSEHRFMVSRAGWYGDYPDPTTFLDINRTGDGNNDRAYSNPEYDSLLDRAADERDPEARYRLLEEAERLIVEEDLPLIPLFHYCQVFMFDAGRVSGITSHPVQEQQLHLVDILGDGCGPERGLALPARGPAR